jgi:hypothetical protein
MKRRKNSNKETEMRKLIKRAEQALTETRGALRSAKKKAIDGSCVNLTNQQLHEFLVSENPVFVESYINNPPVIEPPIRDKFICEDLLLEFTITATDPDGDRLSYSESNLPKGPKFNPDTQTFS